MWRKKKKEGKVWYEFALNDSIVAWQGTKTFNPLEEIEHERDCGLQQIHSSIVRYAGDGCGYIGDGLWTDEKGMMIYIKTADCLPIILYNKRGIVGILHVGWRGTLLRLPKKFLLMMKRKGIPPSSWIVAFGVSIECKNYQVGEEVSRLFNLEGLNGINLRDNKYHLDLVQANLEELEKFGITEFHLFPEGTNDSENFYSYRKGDKGKQITACIL